MTRLIVGNLDCELSWAGHGSALPAPVARRVSALATLLRGFADDGDRLWTPQPVAIERLPAFVGAPRIELVSGRLSEHNHAAGGNLLLWGATIAAASQATSASPNMKATDVVVHGWRAAPWRLGVANPTAAHQGNDRRLALAVASSLGAALPGARVIDDVTALRAHLAAGGADASGGAWVVKAPVTAAGRDRARGSGGRVDGEAEAATHRLLARFGALIFEPWCSRQEDFACCGIVTGDGGNPGDVTVAAPHRLLVDSRGGFRGVSIDDDGAGAGLGDGQRARLAEAATAAGRALGALGYRGPFGVDAFGWRDAAGVEHFHPLCEINARLTFGWVARAWSERLGEPLALHVGRRPPPNGARLLLTPSGGDDTTAWITPS